MKETCLQVCYVDISRLQNYVKQHFTFAFVSKSLKNKYGIFLKIELWDPCALDAFITISLFTFNAFCIINHESLYRFLPWFEDFWGKYRGGKHFFVRLWSFMCCQNWVLIIKFVRNYFSTLKFREFDGKS